MKLVRVEEAALAAAAIDALLDRLSIGNEIRQADIPQGEFLDAIELLKNSWVVADMADYQGYTPIVGSEIESTLD